MAITTLILSKMARRWRDILRDSARIRQYCQNNYGKPPTIFLGVNGKKLPDERHCPAIFILPGIKTEGLIPEFQYALSVSWSIKQPDVEVDGIRKKWTENLTGESIEFLGVTESDQFGQMIFEELQSAVEDDFPITKMDYNIEIQEHYPQFPGFMILTTEIEPAMGEEITY